MDEGKTGKVEVIPYRTLKGEDIPWAVCVRDPRILQQKRARAKAYVENGRRPEDGMGFLSAERANGTVMGRHVIAHELTDKSHTIPVIYPPDSGLPMAEGFLTACKQNGVPHQLYATTGTQDSKDHRSWAKYSYAIPPEAIEQARQAGTLVICEGTIDRGHTLRSCLNSIPDDFDGKVIVAASKELVGNTAFIGPNYIMNSDFMKMLGEINTGKTPKQFRITLLVAERMGQYEDKGLPDIGDTIAAIYQKGEPGLRGMAERLTKRKPKDNGPSPGNL